MSARSLLPAVVAAVLAVALTAAIDGPKTASAHPLGNFSVNRLLVLNLEETGVLNGKYIVDTAEIPTFQRIDEIDKDGNRDIDETESSAFLAKEAPRLLSNVDVKIAGARVDIDVTGGSVRLLEGQGGLDTMRVVLELTGTLPDGWRDGVSASVRDRNYDGQVGWHQIVVRPGTGVDLFRTTAALEDVTQELTAYPQDLLKSPPSVSEASFDFRPGETTLVAPSQPSGKTVGRDAAQRTLGRFASLVDRENVTPAFAALALLLAAGWGAMHALGPGHGKTIVAAYLVGERGTGRHALFLGFVVTATHTISVFTLGLIALFASDVLSADDLYFWLSLVSGVMVATLGGGLLISRVRTLLRGRSHLSHVHSHHDHAYNGEHAHDAHEHHHGHSHDHGHNHGHSHDHGESHEHAEEGLLHAPLKGQASHAVAQHEHAAHEKDHHHGHSHMPTAPGWRGLLALGISGGLVPCPTALVVMLGAIAVHRTVYGLVLVTAFSVGLAGVLTGIGLLLVYGRHFLDRRAASVSFLNSEVARRFVALSPVLSALGILGLGLMLTGRAML